MKRILFAVALSAASLGAWAGINTLKVVPVEGDAVFFHVDGTPTMTLQDDKLHIEVSQVGAAEGQQPAEFDIDGISHVEFVNEGTGVETAARPQFEIFREGARITFRGLEPGSRISAFTIDGRTVAEFSADGEATLDLSAQAPGIYAVRVNSFSFKIRI